MTTPMKNNAIGCLSNTTTNTTIMLIQHNNITVNTLICQGYLQKGAGTNQSTVGCLTNLLPTTGMWEAPISHGQRYHRKKNVLLTAWLFQFMRLQMRIRMSFIWNLQIKLIVILSWYLIYSVHVQATEWGCTLQYYTLNSVHRISSSRNSRKDTVSCILQASTGSCIFGASSFKLLPAAGTATPKTQLIILLNWLILFSGNLLKIVLKLSHLFLNWNIPS